VVGQAHPVTVQALQIQTFRQRALRPDFDSELLRPFPECRDECSSASVHPHQIIHQSEADPAVVRQRNFSARRSVARDESRQNAAQTLRQSQRIQILLQQNGILLLERHCAEGAVFQVEEARIEENPFLIREIFPDSLPALRIKLFEHGADVFSSVGELEQTVLIRQINLCRDGVAGERRLEIQHPEHIAHTSVETGGEMKSCVERNSPPVESLHASADHGTFFDQQNAGSAGREQNAHRHSRDAASEHDKIILLIQLTLPFRSRDRR